MTREVKPTHVHAGMERRRCIKLLGLAALLAAAVWLGRDFAHHLPALEHWIASHGWIGWLVFVGAAVVFTSMFVPDTLFAVVAGVLFGVLDGTLLMILATLCTATVDFALARSLLRRVVENALSSRPRLAAIRRAVGREGFRFQLLLRLTPINPVTVSYVLGASGTRFPAFLAGCAGLIPTLFVEVYFGHAASHAAAIAGGVSRHSLLHTALTVTGLLLCVAVLVYITRIARKAMADYEPQESVRVADGLR